MPRNCLQKYKVLHQSGRTNWTVLESQGAYPALLANATNDEKKAIIYEFVLDEHDILVVQSVENLLKNQFIEAVSNCVRDAQATVFVYAGLIKAIRHTHTHTETQDYVLRQYMYKILHIA